MKSSIIKSAIALTLVFFASCSPNKTVFDFDIFKRVDPTAFRVAQREAFWQVADANGAAIEFVCLGAAANDELITNALDWINRYVGQQTKHEIILRKGKSQRAALFIGFGEKAGKEFGVTVDPGPQGFVLKQAEIDGKKAMYCWSPTALGCRYGLIEFLRSLKTHNDVVVSDIQHVVDAPDFPVRIHYINSAEHLQNAFNPNYLFDVPFNRWSLKDWENYIDMISAFRYNFFEFWLPPSFLGLKNQKLCDEFVPMINHVIAYAKRRGIAVHPLVTINTIGSLVGEWHYACPNDPEDKKKIVDGWDFWTKSIKGNFSWCFFPGDPGGCAINGCTKETYIDLCLELSALIRKNNPTALIEVSTWGEPFFSWGIPCPKNGPWWQWDKETADRSMDYLIRKLPEFPSGTFVSINRAFSPEADPDVIPQFGGGGDGRPYAKRAADLVPVLTWDFCVPESENSVIPHCRVRRMIDVRKKELEAGCYSGGIIFTMSPRLQILSAFCGGETWWNSDRKAEEILDDYGRWIFGEGNEQIGRLLEEFEIIPDGIYFAPFNYSAERVHERMNRLLPKLEQLDDKKTPRLPLLVDYGDHVKTLKYYTTLFRDLSKVSMQVDALNAAFQKTPFAGEKKDTVSLADVQRILASKPNFAGRGDLEAAAKKLTKWDIPAMKNRYWDFVYHIYEHIPAQAEDRKPEVMENIFEIRFQASRAETVNSIDKKVKHNNK